MRLFYVVVLQEVPSTINIQSGACRVITLNWSFPGFSVAMVTGNVIKVL